MTTKVTIKCSDMQESKIKIIIRNAIGSNFSSDTSVL